MSARTACLNPANAAAQALVVDHVALPGCVLFRERRCGKPAATKTERDSAVLALVYINSVAERSLCELCLVEQMQYALESER